MEQLDVAANAIDTATGIMTGFSDLAEDLKDGPIK